MIQHKSTGANSDIVENGDLALTAAQVGWYRIHFCSEEQGGRKQRWCGRKGKKGVSPRGRKEEKKEIAKDWTP
ncbi:hypothetical protein Y1Q_0014439 [Alligator mississippiensis]|uniref:Uncharacterized protein n=1 Tax=Alligator mississippiensis TaxID=8496 RepID=A0A151PCR0_ALLMI|nr:hypothetical protein Y1Q_0014439 [Alligator mississippiensis]